MYAAHNTWSMIHDGMYWAGCVCWLPMYDVIAITLAQYAIHCFFFVAHKPIVVEFIYGCSFTFNSANALQLHWFCSIHVHSSHIHTFIAHRLLRAQSRIIYFSHAVYYDAIIKNDRLPVILYRVCGCRAFYFFSWHSMNLNSTVFFRSFSG